MKQSIQDVYDLAHLRVYRVMSSWKNPFFVFCGTVFLLGFILCMIGALMVDYTPDIVFESSDGAQLIYSQDNNYILGNDQVYFRYEGEEQDNSWEVVYLFGIGLFVLAVIIFAGYIGWWIQVKSDEAGWDAVKQLELQQEE